MANDFIVTDDIVIFGKASIGDSGLSTSGTIRGNLDVFDSDPLNPGGIRINLVSSITDPIQKGIINFGTSDAVIAAGTQEGSIEFDHNTDTFNFRINGASIPQFTFDEVGATFLGNLTVLGTTITIDSATLAITDPLITVNKDEVGPGVSLVVAGIEVERGTGPIPAATPNTGWIFNEGDDSWGPDGIFGFAGFTKIARVNIMDTGGVGNSLQILGNGALRVPVGTTAQQPANLTGNIRFNTDNTALEYNDGAVYRSLSTAFGQGEFVSRSGDTMNGALVMNNGQLLGNNIGSPTAPAFAFNTDANTGIHRNGPDSLSIITNSTDRMSFDNVGNISLNGGSSGNVTLNGTRAMNLHSGTTAQRPPANNGMIRYNTDSQTFEGHENSVWKSFVTAAAGGGFVAKTGDIMAGTLVMNGTTIQPLNDNTGGVGVPAKRFASMHAVTFFGTATAALYADLAERYASDMLLDVGTVVVFGGEAEITECVTHANTAVAGVISGKPGIMMNHEAGPDSTHPYVALKGKVPCKVIGPVKKGDLMITSMIRGHGKSAGKTANPYTAFARALEDRNVGLTEQGIIMVSII